MGRFLDAAYRVLTDRRQPLGSDQITDIALEQGWLKTKGKTPQQTMKAKLSVDILRRGSKSPFMRTAEATFALREWKDIGTPEYTANRYQRALLEEDVVVFPADLLGRYVPGPGLHSFVLTQGRELLNHCVPMGRLEAEKDFTVIQLVSVFIVRHGRDYLTYKRTKRLPEQRLHGEYSLIFGGHLNPEDVPTLLNLFHPQEGQPFLLRELAEEVRFDSKPRIEYRGILYDDSRELSRQHLGIVYDVCPQDRKFHIGERGFLVDAKYESPSEISGRLSDFENWSCLVFDTIR